MSFVGEIGLGLRVTDDVIKVLTFIKGWVHDARHFGDDVHAFRALLTSETARLQAFLAFLREKDLEGGSRLDKLPSLNRTAIVWMIEELDMKFKSYSEFVEKHSVEELQRGYESGARLEVEGIQNAENAKEGVQKIQADASLWGVTKWGLFGKNRLEKLLRGMAEWNNRLQNLLLCGLCFGSEPIRFQDREHSILDNLRLSTGLSLRTLLANQETTPNVSTTITEPTLTLASVDPNAKIQELLRQTSAGVTERQRVLVEFKEYELKRNAIEPSREMVRQVKNLANLLAHPRAPGAGFRTLQCVGLVQQKVPTTRFAFALDLPVDVFPADETPPSLYELILSKENRPTLGQKYAMARALSETVFQLHSVDWLHKSVRSENVIFGRDVNGEISYDKPYLIGFEFSRMGNDRSTTEHDDILDRNIYRHPDRQGPPNESQRFTVLHDIYSLGVVLLEIGLWRAAIKFDEAYEDKEPDGIMEDLQENAKDRLPHYMGLDYEQAVSTCLNGNLIDPGRSNQLVLPIHDQERMAVNMALLEKVIKKIEIGCTLR